MHTSLYLRCVRVNKYKENVVMYIEDNQVKIPVNNCTLSSLYRWTSTIIKQSTCTERKTTTVEGFHEKKSAITHPERRNATNASVGRMSPSILSIFEYNPCRDGTQICSQD